MSETNDERDAKAAYDIEAPNRNRDGANGFYVGFLSGRKGMVPASEVGAKHSEYLSALAALELRIDARIAEAVKATRERCLEDGTIWKKDHVCLVRIAVKAERERIISELKDYMRAPSFEVVDRLQMMRAIERRILNPKPGGEK